MIDIVKISVGKCKVSELDNLLGCVAKEWNLNLKLVREHNIALKMLINQIKYN